MSLTTRPVLEELAEGAIKDMAKSKQKHNMKYSFS